MAWYEQFTEQWEVAEVAAGNWPYGKEREVEMRDETLRPWRFKEGSTATVPTRKYRIAWIVEPGKDFSAIEHLARDVRYVTKGYEKSVDKLAESIRESRKSFDPAQDILVPVGRVTAVLLTGLLFGQVAGDISFAIYAEGEYHEGLWRREDEFALEVS